ncbi:hypothetical protein [Actinokineospora sp.]|uniref:hypothetical protein n=1 Tax=Actinokineospora sp. TaxID=1872133 RepID=UPI0040377F18
MFADGVVGPPLVGAGLSGAGLSVGDVVVRAVAAEVGGRVDQGAVGPGVRLVEGAGGAGSPPARVGVGAEMSVDPAVWAEARPADGCAESGGVAADD